MVDLKKHNDESNENKAESRAESSYCSMIRIATNFIMVIVLLFIFLFVYGSLIEEIFTSLVLPEVTISTENTEYVSPKVFSLTVTGKSQNTVSGVFVMEFADDKGTSRSFKVSEKLFNKYEIGSQVEITVDYQAGTFTFDNEKIKEVE